MEQKPDMGIEPGDLLVEKQDEIHPDDENQQQEMLLVLRLGYEMACTRNWERQELHAVAYCWNLAEHRERLVFFEDLCCFDAHKFDRA